MHSLSTTRSCVCNGVHARRDTLRSSTPLSSPSPSSTGAAMWRVSHVTCSRGIDVHPFVSLTEETRQKTVMQCSSPAGACGLWPRHTHLYCGDSALPLRDITRDVSSSITAFMVFDAPCLRPSIPRVAPPSSRTRRSVSACLTLSGVRRLGNRFMCACARVSAEELTQETKGT